MPVVDLPHICLWVFGVTSILTAIAKMPDIPAKYPQFKDRPGSLAFLYFATVMHILVWIYILGNI